MRTGPGLIKEGNRSVGQLDHFSVPRAAVDGALQIEQSTGGVIEMNVRGAKAANKKRTPGKFLAREGLPVGHD